MCSGLGYLVGMVFLIFHYSLASSLQRLYELSPKSIQYILERPASSSALPSAAEPLALFAPCLSQVLLVQHPQSTPLISQRRADSWVLLVPSTLMLCVLRGMP